MVNPTSTLFICWALAACIEPSRQYDSLFYGPGRKSPETANDISDSVPFLTASDTEILEESSLAMTLASDYPCPTKCVCFAKKFAHCSRTNLTSFPSDVQVTNSSKNSSDSTKFEAVFPAQIDSLYLGFNAIPQLKNKCLIASGEHLKVLSLTHNQINRISSLAFEGLNNLEQLDLSYNQLRSVIYMNKGAPRRAVSIFSPMRESLVSLYLSHNFIRGIPSESFTNFTKLEVLTLSHNEIAWISKHAFRSLKKLRILHIRDNRLNRNTIGRLPEIFNHYYVQNSARHRIEATCLSVDSFQNFNENDLLTYGQNYNAQTLTPDDLGPLKTLDFGRSNLHKVPRKLPNSLQILFLDGNFIHAVRARDFKGMVLLETLHLSSNELRTIELGSFDSLYQLRRLDLSKNQLRRLHPNTFCGLLTLSDLRLYQNPRLTSLPKKIFGSNRSLKILYLQDCGIRTLPSGPWIYRLAALWLYGNPIDCQCRNVVPIIMRLQGARTKPFSLDTFRLYVWDGGDTWQDQRLTDTTCNSPSRFRGYPVRDVRTRDLYCSGADFYNITINKQLANMANDYSYYQNDQPSQEQETEYSDYNKIENGKKLADSEYGDYLEKDPSKQGSGIEILEVQEIHTLPAIPKIARQPNGIIHDVLYSEELGSAKQNIEELSVKKSNQIKPDFQTKHTDKDLVTEFNLDEPEYDELSTDDDQLYNSIYNETDDNEEASKQIIAPRIYIDNNDTNLSDQMDTASGFQISDTLDFLNKHTDDQSRTSDHKTGKDNPREKNIYETNVFTTKQIGETWLFEIPPPAQFYDDVTDKQPIQNSNNNHVTKSMTSRLEHLFALNTEAPKRNIFPPTIELDGGSATKTTSQNNTMTSEADNPARLNDESAGFFVDEYEYPENVRLGPSLYQPDPDYENSGETPSASEGDFLSPGEYLVFKRKLARANINDEYYSYYFDSLASEDDGFYAGGET